jgi:hypothetical protein
MEHVETKSVRSQKAEPGEVLKSLVNVHYAKANSWKTALLALQMALYAAGVVAVFAPALTTSYPPVAVILALSTTWIGIQASKFKSTADSLKRQYEYWQGFGKELPKGMLADLRVAVSGRIDEYEDRLLQKGLSFSSSKPLGPTRVLENLCESAWFTKHLAAWCGRWLGVVFVLAAVLSVALLLISINSLTGLSSRVAAAQCVSVTLTSLLSLGILHSWLAFRDYSQKAGDIENEAQRLLKSGTTDVFDAQRALSEYQLVRAGGPTIPTLVWKMQRDRLNDNWNDLKKPTN